MGLPVSRGLARLLGGDLTYAPVAPGGSVFRLVIPLSKGSPQSAEQIYIEEGKANAGTSFNILVAEDLEVNFIYLREVLSELPVKIFHAWNGEEVMHILKKQQVHLVLMDIRMPKLDGLSAMRQIKQSNPGLPVIAQTAYGFEGEGGKYLSWGFDGFLSKPVKRKKLLETVQYYIPA